MKNKNETSINFNFTSSPICKLFISSIFISLFNSREKNVWKDCLESPFIETTSVTECVLECQRRQLISIHKEGECFCVENDCFNGTKGDEYKETQVIVPENTISKCLKLIVKKNKK